MMQKTLWILFAVLAILIGLYPSIYLFIGKFGLLAAQADHLLSSPLWNIAFYTHIGLGGVALLTGWPQFSPRLRNRRLQLHRQLGKIYVIAVLLSAVSGIYIGVFASGGIIPKVGFVSLGIVWLVTTVLAYQYIRQGQLAAHQRMMIYSYAACFAAVTLRIWLPLLTILTGSYLTAYRVVAWGCWVPNMLVAWWLNRPRTTQFSPAP